MSLFKKFGKKTENEKADAMANFEDNKESAVASFEEKKQQVDDALDKANKAKKVAGFAMDLGKVVGGAKKGASIGKPLRDIEKKG